MNWKKIGGYALCGLLGGASAIVGAIMQSQDIKDTVSETLSEEREQLAKAQEEESE